MPDPLFPQRLNDHALPHPPTAQPISIHDLIQIRLALDTLKFQSKLTQESIGHLDRVIHVFTASLNPGAPKS